MIVIINDTLGAYGGTHTLTLRICQWLKDNGYLACVFCESADNTEIVSELTRIGTEIFCINTADTKKTYEVIHKLLLKDSLRIVSYMWDKYLDMEIVKFNYGCLFDNIHYCVHYGTFMRGSTYPSIIRKQIKKRFLNILIRMNNNKSIVMMDEDTTDKTSEYFDFMFVPSNSFVRIPMLCHFEGDYQKTIREGFNGNIIMSASRAEFPYKGYQLGLIDEFVRIKEDFDNIKLLLVSGGEKEDIARIEDKINELPEELRQDVEFHQWMSYAELKIRIGECKIFVGMGTSVLDAALQYKPSIPVKYNTYDLITSGFLSEKPELLTSDTDHEMSAHDLLKRLFEMSENEYEQEAVATFNAVKGCYDIDTNMRKMLEIYPCCPDSLLTGGEIKLIKFLRNVSKIKHLRDKKKKFDFTQITTD